MIGAYAFPVGSDGFAEDLTNVFGLTSPVWDVDPVLLPIAKIQLAVVEDAEFLPLLGYHWLETSSDDLLSILEVPKVLLCLIDELGLGCRHVVWQRSHTGFHNI